jgi:C-terminal processing protease CtpA/Prc
MAGGGGRGGASPPSVVAGGGGGGGGGSFASITVTSAQLDIKNFGLVLECRPACRRARAADATMYLQFDGYPAVVAPAAGSVAARAGLHDGDIVVAVHNLSPLTEEGALLLNRAERVLTLDLEISRGGKREKITLKL